jgi:hypothetical protein
LRQRSNQAQQSFNLGHADERRFTAAGEYAKRHT